LSHARERRKAKRSGGKESGEEAPRKFLTSRLRRSLSLRALVLQREPARRLDTDQWISFLQQLSIDHNMDVQYQRYT